MRTHPYTVEEIAEKYIAGAGAAFSLADLVRAAQTQGKNVAEPGLTGELRELLKDHLLLFPDGTDRYLPRRVFFKKAEFCVTPSEEEIKKGVLFPGDRLVPFLSEQVFPADARLVRTGTRKALATKVISCPVTEAVAYHALLGPEEMFNYFIADHLRNRPIIEKGQLTDALDVTVFDFHQIYQEYAFKPDDVLLFKVTNWDKGMFSFTFVPAEERRGGPARAHWRQTFETCLQAVIEEYGCYINIPEQLAQTYFRGKAQLLAQPALSVDEVRRDSEVIGLKKFGSQCVLWNSGDELEEPNQEIPEEIMISAGKTGSLSEIFTDIGLPLNALELEAYMLDELFNGGESLAAVLDRCLAPWPKRYQDEAQEVVCQNLLEDLWEYRLAGYNRFHDEYKGVIREAVLKIVEARLEWLSSLQQQNFDDAGFPRKKMLALAELNAQLDQLLAETVKEGPFTPGPEEMNRIMAAIEDLGVRQEQLIAAINHEILDLPGGNPSAKPI